MVQSLKGALQQMPSEESKKNAQEDAFAGAANSKYVTATCESCGDQFEIAEYAAKHSDNLVCNDCRPPR